jgi:hypothetical protein
MKSSEFIVELFDANTAFPIEWVEKPGVSEAWAEDSMGRDIQITFTDFGDRIVIIEFSRGGSFDLTSSGEAGKVFGTVIAAIGAYCAKHAPTYILFSAKESSRINLYNKMTQRISTGYKLLPPDQYPRSIHQYLKHIGNSHPYVLRRA